MAKSPLVQRWSRRLAKQADEFVRLPRRWPWLLLFWAAISAASYGWHRHELQVYADDMATLRGRLIFQMVETMRDWAARQSHLSGMADNSALMTRQLGEIMQESRDRELTIHLTSLKLLNPDNEPDAWETEALRSFEQGTAERVGVDGKRFRYMAPLPTKASCLVCHAHQGHVVGDIRGGLSVSFPTRYIDDIVGAQRRSLILIHLGAFTGLSMLSIASLAALRRRLRELDQTRTDLAETEKMASLGRMVAGFAHEVNTPVGVAVGAVSQSRELVAELERLIAQEEVTEDDLRDRMSMLDEASQLALTNLHRAAGMVQSFKRTAVDQTSEAERRFDLAEVFEDVQKSLHNRFKNTAVRVTIDCPSGTMLFGMPGALEQVLTNLLENGRIHGFAEGKAPGNISLRGRIEGGKVRIDYSDDGAGMHPDVLAHAFEPFYTTRRGSGGSGLGLYIAYNLVTRNLGGSVHCESTQGEGTRFFIEFPYHATQDSPQTP